MNLLEEIRHGLANLEKSGRMLPIDTLPQAAPAWIFWEGDLFGVAIELPDDRQVVEVFTGAKLVTVERLINGETRRLLRLESSIQSLRNEFAVVCAHMVEPGPDNRSRAELISDPLTWWQRWRHLLGNAIVTQTIYDTLAELLAIERLLERGEKVEWRGPSGGVVDIDTPSAGYEVKSTISRYDSRVHVSGQFQLALSSSKPLNLLHYRFEPTASGESIDSMCVRLIDAGFAAEQLESSLTRCGLEAGCSARRETFTVLESRLFPVDNAFPRITPESFAKGVLPSGVVHIEYQVDLAGFAHEPF